MATDALTAALEELLSALGPDGTNVVACGGAAAKLAKRKELKEDLKPLSGYLKHLRRDLLVQLALESPPTHPLHLAVKSLLGTPLLPCQPWVRVGSGEVPPRHVERLQVSARAPVVYALEQGLRISVWSLETGALIEDLEVPARKGLCVRHFAELPDGTLRGLASIHNSPLRDGVLVEKKPGDAVFTRVLSTPSLYSLRSVSDDLRFMLSFPQIQPDSTPAGHMQRLVLSDITTGKSREVRFPGSNVSAVAYRSGVFTFGLDQDFDDESQPPTFALVVLDPETGAMQSVAIECTASFLSLDAAPDLLEVGMWDGPTEKPHLFNVVTRMLTPGKGTRLDATVRLPDGTAFDGRTIQPPGKARPFEYLVPGHSHHLCSAADPRSGRLVVAGADGPACVTVLERYAALTQPSSPPCRA